MSRHYRRASARVKAQAVQIRLAIDAGSLKVFGRNSFVTSMAQVPILHAEGFLLRPLRAEDALIIYRNLDDPETNRLTGTQEEASYEDVVAHLRRIGQASDRADFGIELGGKLIGECVLSGIDRTNRSASFRIAIWDPAARGKGIGTAATRMTVSHAFTTLDLNRVELEVYAFNPKARHIYQNLGFTVEGVRRQALWWEGEPVDAIMMAILRDEFEPLRDDELTA